MTRLSSLRIPRFILAIVAALSLMVAPTAPLTAAGEVVKEFSAEPGTEAGGVMAEKAGGQVNTWTQFLWGPIMYLVITLAALVAIFGFATGKKEMALVGLGVFALTASLRVLMPLIF